MSGRGVVVAVFFSPFEAEMCAAMLDGEGITCFLRDLHTLQANPLAAIPVGGVKLEVAPREAMRTRAILVIADAPGLVEESIVRQSVRDRGFDPDLEPGDEPESDPLKKPLPPDGFADQSAVETDGNEPFLPPDGSNKCPRCESYQIVPATLGVLSSIYSSLMGSGASWQCQDCDHDWYPDEDWET